MVTDEQAFEAIANAVFVEDIEAMSEAELGELAKIYWMDDPDVEFVDLDYTLEAGADGHGTNTEEEMLHTLEEGA